MAIIAEARQSDVDYMVVDSVPTPLAGALPLPRVTWGWVTTVEFVEEYVIEGFIPPYYIMSALQPEGEYLEPTVGQIWPRIG
jgi:hypothetical protein